MSKNTDLIAAISANDLASVISLLNTGADPNSPKGAALTTAINVENYLIAHLLLRHEASPEPTLPLAIKTNKPEFVRLHLKYIFENSNKDAHKKTLNEALQLAISCENADIIQILTEYKAPVMQNGNKFLHEAAANGKTAVIQGILRGLEMFHTTRQVPQISPLLSALNSGGNYALRLAQQNRQPGAEAILQEFHKNYGYESAGHPNSESTVVPFEITPEKSELRGALYEAAQTGKTATIKNLMSKSSKWGFYESELEHALALAIASKSDKAIGYLKDCHVSMPNT